MRIGFLGAGSIARHRHLPGLSQIDGVEVVVVANRSLESGRRVAHDFGISEVSDDWRQVVCRDDIEAVFIGTWPYRHREMSVAALEAGKHVFCQARMAMNLEEAREMVETARRNPGVVNMICPPPHRMPYERFIRNVIESGQLGELTSIELTVANGGNLDRNGFSWREDRALSGDQILAVGIFAETLNAWVGDFVELSAITGTAIPRKTTPDGTVTIEIPQTVTVVGKLGSGAVVTEHHTGLAADSSTRGAVLTIRGLEGSLRHHFGDTVPLIAAAGGELAPAIIPSEMSHPWQVEQDFVKAVRAAQAGKDWSVSPDFEEGLRYMKKIEAIHVSAREGRCVKLDTL